MGPSEPLDQQFPTIPVKAPKGGLGWQTTSKFLPPIQAHGAFQWSDSPCKWEVPWTCPHDLKPVVSESRNCKTFGQESFLNLRLVTYNTLSVVATGQGASLEREMRRLGIHVLGLQECRESAEAIRIRDGVCKIAGPAANGHLGCQVWVDCARGIADFPDGGSLMWQRQAFTIIHATHRVLVVGAQAGRQRFAFVVAHACTAVTDIPTKEQFWQELEKATHAIPRGHVPLWFIDANARFEPGTHTPLGQETNAHALRDLSVAQGMSLSGNVDASGNPLVTWRAPGCCDGGSCVDYIAVPEAWSVGRVVHGDLDMLDVHAGHDHFPVAVDAQAWVVLGGRRPCAGIDVEQLHTPEGRQKAERIFAFVDWSVDADNHVAHINEYLLHCFVKEFPRSGRPRNPALSGEAWAIIAPRRQVRRIMHRSSSLARKILAHTVFRAWRALFRRVGRTESNNKLAIRIARLGIANAKLARVLRGLSASLRVCVRRDEADFTRRMYQHARHGQMAVAPCMAFSGLC